MTARSRVPIIIICCAVSVSVALLAVSSDAAAESSDSAESSRAEERFEFTSYVDVSKLFEELNYTPEAWQEGIREVPRVYLTTIAPRWRSRVSKDVSVQEKKRIFFRSMAPLVLHSNEFILRDRARLEAIRGRWTADDAFLGDGPTIFLVPVGEGAS